MRPFTSSPRPPGPWNDLKALSLIAACGLLGFFGTLHSPFQYDDAHAIVQNPYITDLGHFQEVVGMQNIFNRSVLLLSFAANRSVGHLDVYGYHLVNIFIHICVGILLYFVTQNLIPLAPATRWDSYKNLPLAAALIHTFNPVAVESVAYISSRSSSLATLFYLAGFYFFQRYSNLESGRFRGLGFFLLVFLCFTLGIATKEIAVTLPIMALVYAWMSSRQRDHMPGILLFLSSILIYLGYRYISMGNILTLPADPASQSMDRGLYFLTQLSVVAFYYLPKLFFPINLNFEPDIRLVAGAFDPQWIMGMIVLLLLSGFLYRRKSPLLTFAFLWMFITLLPTSSVIPLKQIASEHRMYLPGLGISLCLGLAFVNRGRFGFRVGLILFLLLTGLLSMNRGLDYKTEISLWKDTAAKSPNKTLAHNNLATAYIPAKLYDDAIRELEITLRLDPNDSDAYINLGFIHASLEQWEPAMAYLDRALLLGSGRAEVYYNSGLVRTRMRKILEAVPFLQKAVDLKPQVAEYHFQLGYAYQQAGNRDAAVKEFRATLGLDPLHLEAQNNIGVIFWSLKAFDQARDAFQKALAIREDSPEIHSNLGNVYMILENYDKAVFHLSRALALQPGNSRARELLAVAKNLKGSESK